VALRILNLGGDVVDTKGATGRLILNIFAGIAQWEREMMLERQRDGIADAKAAGRYAKKRNGRAKKEADAIRQLAQEGRNVSQIAKEVGIARHRFGG